MNSLEKKMVNTLINLRENHHVVGVKCEFEAEGTRLEEALRLKEVVTRSGLDLTIKIGGCEALKDMYEARTIGVNAIVAPMIESPYAMKKYIQATKLAFPEEEEREETDFFINIETITGYNCVDEILKLDEAKDLKGIVFGRGDMTGSLGLSREDVNIDKILEIANNLAVKCLEHDKNFIIGGGVSTESLPFFKKLPKNSLSKFETRKIIFDAQKALEDENTDKGILKALDFQIMWLKNKRDLYGMIHNEDAQRIIMLENYYKQQIEAVRGVYA